MSLGYKASSIIGGPLDPNVIDQLKVRKSLVSNTDQSGVYTERNQDSILALNGSTGWVKLTSSVDVLAGENADGKDEYSNLSAKNNILLGGTITSEKQLGGIFNDQDNAYKKSQLFGYRPMAGITGLQVDAKNNFGTLRVASVDFKVNSVEDLDELEQLFLRPGFSVLLEWGHSLYFENNRKLQSTVTTVGDQFLTKMTSSNIHNEIKKLKLSSSGNYDGLYGIIKNFIWAFNLDGGYDCRVDIVSKGELIESLEMIISPLELSLERFPSSYQELTKKTALHGFLNIIKYAPRERQYDVTNVVAPIPLDIANNKLIKEQLGELIPGIYEKFTSNLTNAGREFHVIEAEVNSADTGGFGPKNLRQWTGYITLSSLLELINLFFTIKTHDGGLIKFFTGSKNNKVSTPFLTFPEHFALDPAIAILPKSFNTTLSKNIRHYKISEQGRLPYGEDDLLNIYINIDYILKAADSIADSKALKADSIYDFLNFLLRGINSTLGDINDFDLHFEEDEDTFYVVDRKVTPRNEDLKESFIDLVGLNSTMENINFASKLSSNITTMMAIAAQAGRTKTGNDMLAMQTWQKGLIDRHNKVKDLALNDIDNVTSLETSTEEENLKRLNTFLDKAAGSFSPLYLNYNKEDIQGVYPAFRLQMVRYLESITIEKKLNPAGLIPFELSFSTKGIGGMKIGQAFIVDDRIIPKRYRGNVGFLITGVSHSIKSNRWVTDIKTQMIVLNTVSDLEKKLTSDPSSTQEPEPSPLSDTQNLRQPSQTLNISNSGRNLIKSLEGLRLKAYKDSVSVNGQPYTIGWGTTKIDGKPIPFNTTITLAQAETFLTKDLKEFENYIKRYVRVDLTQEEFNALVSLVYNIGPGAFQSSTLLQKLNSKDYEGAADQFLNFNKGGSPKKVIAGLTRRRANEKALFLTNSPGNP